MSKFCCDGFRFHHTAVKGMGLNFRIIRLSSKFIARAELPGSVYKYLITPGYDYLDDSVKTLVMHYCPYCGFELKKFYTFDEYINEKDHPF